MDKDFYKWAYYIVNHADGCLRDQIEIRMTEPFYQDMKKDLGGRVYLNYDEDFKYFMGVPLIIVPGQGKWCSVVRNEVLGTWNLYGV